MGVYCLHKSKINNTASCRLQGSLQPTSQPTWWNFGFGPWKISEISNKSQKAHVCALGSELVWNLLVPPCYLKWSMTNINMEVVFTYPSYMCGERMRDPHTLTRFAGAGRGMARHGEGRGRTTFAWMVRRNPAPRLVGALLPFVFGYLAFKLTRYGSLICFLIVQNRSQLGSWALLYIRPIDLHQNTF